MATIAELMSRDLLSVAGEERLPETARRMVERGVGAVLVLAGDRLEGILTERDVLKAVALGISESARVRDWMTKHPETVEASETAEHAAALMIHGGFRHLPVLEGEAVVGIVSIRDLMRVTLEDSAPRGV